ncbi:alpha/beta hydrolase [Deinococcus sp. Marseille-Q6407]|uniref:alpha/beta hydrolase n=1 Tax=Deinococcus sp. Marseille-Q6407 TaxID=2969223 RepID=UPI0021BE5054|nr:alpha/beta hydrolase [Deinococcus sp. Marseille-Q6407]
MTLLQMYKSAPERFKGLILIDTTADPAGPAEAGMWRGVAQQAQERGVSSLVDVLMPRMMTGADRLNQPAQAGHLKTLIKQASRDGAVGGANALANRPDARPVLKSIRVPTLLIFGLEDNVTAAEGAKKMNQDIAGSQLVMIPGAGHAAIFEKAGAANAAIALWLSSNR